MSDTLTARPTPNDSAAWTEYDHAAADLARRGLKGAIGDPLPNLMSARAVELINDDPEAFETRVRQYAYAQTMEKLNLPDDAD
jgi:hypothetical protein